MYLAALVVYGWQVDLDALMTEPIVPLRLAGLLVVQALIAEGLTRWHRRVDGHVYAVGSSVSTVLAGVLVMPFALDYPWAAALVYAHGSCSPGMAPISRWRLAELTYGSSLILSGAIFFAFREFTPDLPFREQLLWSLLTLATICLGRQRAASAPWLDRLAARVFPYPADLR